MITIKFNNKTQTLTVSGHALYQNENDIVCAGVSSIVLGASSYWYKLDLITVKQKDSGWIQIQFKNDCLTNDLILQSEFLLFWHQLTILTANYQSFVTIESQPDWINVEVCKN